MTCQTFIDIGTDSTVICISDFADAVVAAVVVLTERVYLTSKIGLTFVDITATIIREGISTVPGVTRAVVGSKGVCAVRISATDIVQAFVGVNAITVFSDKTSVTVALEAARKICAARVVNAAACIVTFISVFTNEAIADVAVVAFTVVTSQSVVASTVK